MPSSQAASSQPRHAQEAGSDAGQVAVSETSPHVKPPPLLVLLVAEVVAADVLAAVVAAEVLAAVVDEVVPVVDAELLPPAPLSQNEVPAQSTQSQSSSSSQTSSSLQESPLPPPLELELHAGDRQGEGPAEGHEGQGDAGERVGSSGFVVGNVHPVSVAASASRVKHAARCGAVTSPRGGSGRPRRSPC